MFFIVVLLFTFSRSECPCPKHFTGRDSWDDNKHWMVRDIVIRSIQGVYVLAVRFKAIKQDRRIERPEARGDDRTNVLPGESTKGGSDWSFVGDAPGPLSAFAWYRRLMAFYPGPRSATSPFFMAKDRIRFYTYTAAMADFQVMLKRVSTDHAYALHGIRVTGWNCGATVSPSLAEAHGGWKPGSAARYSRFQLSQVFALPAQMMAAVPATPVQTPPTVMAAHGADEGEVLPPLDDFLAGEVPGFQPGVEAGVLPPLADFLAGEVPGFQPGAEAAASGANTTLRALMHSPLCGRRSGAFCADVCSSSHVVRAPMVPLGHRHSCTVPVAAVTIRSDRGWCPHSRTGRDRQNGKRRRRLC